MSNSYERYQKRRLNSSYISVVLSISLVLFVLGALGLVVVKSSKIANHFKSQIELTLFLKDRVSNAQISNLKKSLKTKKYTRDVVFLSKKEAAVQFSKDIGEDFLEFLGENPLKNALDISLKPEFVTPQQMAQIKRELSKNAYVAEVTYDAPLIELLTANVKKISFWVLVVAGFFTLISVILINSSIRLSVYSKRFTIKTMQMVGATKRFIRIPFIWTSIKLGIAGAFLSSFALASTIYYLSEKLPTLELLSDYKELAMVFTGVFLVGIFVTWFSTFLATQRFLNLKTDQLYS
ncbi:MAG: cell division protein FtsX [Flavicella sp.]